MRIKHFTAGDLVSIINRHTGERQVGIVVRDGWSSLYDANQPGKSYCVYSVMIDGKVRYVDESTMRLEK